MAWQSPKLDWDSNPTNPVAMDFNRIEQNIDFLKTDIETKKGAIVTALNSVGIATLIADTHVQIASKITNAKKTGVVITPSTVDQAIPKGIYDTGGGKIIGDPNLIASNIKSKIKVFEVIGNVTEFPTTGIVGTGGDYNAPSWIGVNYEYKRSIDLIHFLCCVYTASNDAVNVTIPTGAIVYLLNQNTQKFELVNGDIVLPGVRFKSYIFLNPNRAIIHAAAQSGYTSGGYFIL